MLGSTQLANDMESADVAIAAPNLSVTFCLMLFITLHQFPKNRHLLQGFFTTEFVGPDFRKLGVSGESALAQGLFGK